MIASVILNYNSYCDTINLVDELHKQTVSDSMFILIVDNCSTNDSYSRLKSIETKYDNVVVIKTEANLGYAKGNNFGLNYLDEHIHPEYVAILNNDVKLPDDCYEQLAERYSGLNAPAIISPVQLDNEKNIVPPLRMSSFADDCLNMFFVTRRLNTIKRNQIIDTTGKNAMEVEMISGSFMFTSFQTFKDMGFFYPNTFLYVEERFVANKAQKLGLHNYLLTNLFYIHAHSKTINSSYNKIKQAKMVYQSRLEYTKVCRKNGRVKALFLKILIPLSLFELSFMNFLKSL